eukprot:jgi/Undpi1/12748/HiC_scaffold_6.g02416.m1
MQGEDVSHSAGGQYTSQRREGGGGGGGGRGEEEGRGGGAGAGEGGGTGGGVEQSVVEISAESKGEEGGDGGGSGGGGEEEEVDTPAEAHYRHYILTQEEATAGVGGGGGGDRGRGGNERLKGRYNFVIIGEGTSADAAVEAILRMRPEAEILFLSDQTPSPRDDSNTHTGTYENDFRLLGTDLVSSFNQWRRHFTFRMEAFVKGGDSRGGGGGGGDGEGRGEGRSEFGLARGKEIVYHTYEPHDLVIEPERRCVRLLLDGIEVYYDKCLIANSGKPRDQKSALRVSGGAAREDGGSSVGRGSKGDEGEGGKGKVKERSSSFGGVVNKLLCLQDFVSLELLRDKPSVKHVTVLGGGFVGCEVALAVAKRGRERGMVVSHVYSESAPMKQALPDYLAEYMQRKLAMAGVTPVTGTSLGSLRYNVDSKRLEGDLKGLDTDYVVLASTLIGPKVDAAKDSGLEIDEGNGGIVVNGLFEAVNGVYAAGGAASFVDPAMGRRHSGSHDHCVNSGLIAGYNMAATLEAAENDCMPSTGSAKGAPPAPYPRLYDHLPFWRSDLAGCDVVMEGLGDVDPSLRTMAVWINGKEDWNSREPSYKRGIVYYMRGDKVAGILLLNVSDQLERAREVLRLQTKITTIHQLKRLIKLGATELIRVVDTPGSLLQ